MAGLIVVGCFGGLQPIPFARFLLLAALPLRPPSSREEKRHHRERCMHVPLCLSLICVYVHLRPSAQSSPILMTTTSFLDDASSLLFLFLSPSFGRCLAEECGERPRLFPSVLRRSFTRESRDLGWAREKNTNVDREERKKAMAEERTLTPIAEGGR